MNVLLKRGFLYSAATTQNLFQYFVWDTFPQAPHWLNLAPGNFYLFLELKSRLGGRKLVTDDLVSNKAVSFWIRSKI